MPKDPPRKPPQEEDLWQKAMKDVTPLSPAPAVPSPQPPLLAPPSSPKALLPPPLRAPVSALPSGGGIDRRTETRFRRGEMEIEGMIDLHGLTQSQAHSKVRSFLLRAAETGKRCLLVITGKGKGPGGGVLRKSLPHWLEDPALAPLILSTAPARLHHGGDGAFYILLRRKRDRSP